MLRFVSSAISLQVFERSSKPVQMSSPRISRGTVFPFSMQSLRNQLLVGLGCLFLSVGICRAASTALVVIGNTGAEADLETYLRMAADTRSALIERGVADVQVLSDKVTRESLLAAIKETGTKAGADGEFWLVLLGHSGKTTNGDPAYQVRGPRATAQDLRTALDEVSATKYVVIATERSGAFLPFLEMPNGSVVAATMSEGQINQPRFQEHWVAALKAAPKASFTEIAAGAAARVEADYKNQGLVQGENARLLVAGNPEILEPPFGVVDVSPTIAQGSGDPQPSENPGFSVNDIKIPKSESKDAFERFEASDETRKLIADAAAALNPGAHPALILNQKIDYTVGKDRSTAETRQMRIYVIRDEALDTWANFQFEQSQGSSTKVLAARVIQPDGTSYVLNPDRFTPSQGMITAPGLPPVSGIVFHLPQVTAGSIVELLTRSEMRADQEIPEFYQEVALQKPAPILNSQFVLKLPKGGGFYKRLMNIDAEPKVSETEHSEVFEWQFTNLPAYEPLPYDPPKRDTAAWLGISSLKSWEDFAQWFLQISHQSDEIDDSVKAKAAEIASLHKNRDSRLRAAFEYAAGLRYVAIEFGINAFRPRTPGTVIHQQYGDCKDKANLLVALLREMKIPANFVLINRGSSTTPEFPGWQFNHAIAYVPAGTDGSPELWLDSTEPSARFGTISPGNLGRSALVFDGKGAKFRVVSGGSKTEIQQSWKFHSNPDSTLGGTFAWKGTGLADYDIRTELAPLLPQQREFLLASKLSTALPGSSASDFQVSNPRDYGSAMTIAAKVELASPAAPVSGLSWMDGFSPITRDRPLRINDGQPLRFTQTVEWPSEATAPLPPKFETEVAGTSLSIQFDRSGETLKRTAVLDVQIPEISPENYAALRTALHDWNRRLAQTPP